MSGQKCAGCGLVWPKLGDTCPRCGGTTPMARGAMRRTRLRPMSDTRRDENRQRRELLVARYGQHPPCELCAPLRAHGVTTGCDGRADDGDEQLRRSAGGSILDVDNVRPVGRACHRWATEHPKEMREWGLERSRYG